MSERYEHAISNIKHSYDIYKLARFSLSDDHAMVALCALLKEINAYVTSFVPRDTDLVRRFNGLREVFSGALSDHSALFIGDPLLDEIVYRLKSYDEEKDVSHIEEE